MASSSSSTTTPWRTSRHHRHTVPNSDYSSFPCYQEEIKLKTNVECDHHHRHHHGGESANATNKEEIQVNVSMHDKLKMCFAEMENMKHQFDNRRRKVQTKKRAHNMNWTTNTTNEEDDRRGEEEEEEATRRQNTAATQQQQQHGEEAKTRSGPGQQTSRATGGGGGGGQQPTESTAHSTLITIDSNDSAPSQFRARLIRTMSKDSMEDPNDKLNPQDIKEPGDAAKLKHQRRTFSEPFGDSILMSEIKRSGRTSQSWLQEQSRVRKEYDDWVNKLEAINDMSQSTITRIRNLENEVMSLKALSSVPPPPTPTSSSEKVVKSLASRIPGWQGGARWRGYDHGKVDKAVNTDIDLRFMNELLGKWKDKKTTSTQTVAEVPAYVGNAHRRLTQPRRLTTTLGRSVEIQTDRNTESKTIQTNFEDEKMQPGSSASKKMDPTMSILDMPNIEDDFVYKPHEPTDLFREGYTKTPEPIVEIHSDSEDTNFEDFEKSIYNEISRRAMINNKILNRKIYDTKKTSFDDLDEFRLKHSSTQTKEESTERAEEKEDVPPRSSKSTKSVGGGAGAGGNVPNKNKLNTTSKITIERCHYDQKEKSEILLKTNIDDKGKVHRVTEVKNSKYAPNEKYYEDLRTRQQPEPKPTPTTNYDGKDSLRKIYSEMNIYPSETYLSRPMSENDVFLGDDLSKPSSSHVVVDNATNHIANLASKKAISSMDLCSKSPVVSEGYHSEYIDPYHKMDNFSRRQTPIEEYILKPPETFQSEPPQQYWEERSKSHVTNKTVEEALEPLRDYEFDKDNLLTLTNETLVDNRGKKTNITTKSRTIRKYKPNRSMAELPLYGSLPRGHREASPVNQSVSQYNLHQLDHPRRDIAYPNQQMIQVNTNKANACNVSLVVTSGGHYNNNVVFRADLGFLKLPAYETNL